MAGLLESVIARARGRKGLGDDLARRFDASRQAVLSRRLVDLDADLLTGVDARLQGDAEALCAAMESVRAQGDAAIADRDWPTVEALRLRAIDLGRDFEELNQTRRKVREARLERLLVDALTRALGSARRRVLYDAFIMTLITGVIGILLYQELGDPTPETVVILDFIDIGACTIFLADFAWRHRLAADKRWFWRRHWIDFVTSIPLPSVHTLRLGRSIRLLRFVRLLRLARLARIVRIVLFFWRGMDKLTAAFDVRMMRRSISILAIVLLIGGLGIWWVEGGQTGAEGVETFGESLWWSFTTVVTGGFGDIRNPETATGRFLTVFLIIAGMVVVGIFTATLTSLLVREGDNAGDLMALEERIDRVLGEVQELRAELAARARSAADLGDGGSTDDADASTPSPST